MKSDARYSSDGLIVAARGWARVLALAPRQLRIPLHDIESVMDCDAEEVGYQLGWRIGGTAISRRRAMGWFTLRHQKGSRAWVWLTPRRTVRVFRLCERRKLRLIAIPVDWFAD